MVRYCSNFKCKLWQPIPTAINDYENKIPNWNRSTKPSIVGQCTCTGAASGDCLRCGGGLKTIFLMDDFDIR